jgi:hypothetical protein
MTSVTQTLPSDPVIRAAGGFAIVSGIISAIGVVFLITMFVLFATPLKTLGLTFGLLNDICVAIQYLLTIPVALALYRILLPYNPALIRLATIVGIAMMLVVIGLQLALIFGVVTFEQQGVWVSLAMIVGVGSWLVITGLVARSTGRLPHSVLMSSVAVPYLGYPVWAFWLGRRLLGW